MSGGAPPHQESNQPQPQPQPPQQQQHQWTRPQLAAFFQHRKHVDNAELSRRLNLPITVIQRLQHHFRDLLSAPNLDMSTFVSTALQWCSSCSYTLLCRASAPQWTQLRQLLATSAALNNKQHRQVCCEHVFANANDSLPAHRRYSSDNEVNVVLPTETSTATNRVEEALLEAIQVGEKVVLWRCDTAEAELGTIAALLPNRKISVVLCSSDNVVQVDHGNAVLRRSDIGAETTSGNAGDRSQGSAIVSQHKHQEDCMNEMAEILRWIDRKATLLAQLKVLNGVCSRSPSAASNCALLKQDYAWIVLELQRTNDVLDKKLQQCRVLVSSGEKARCPISAPSRNAAEILQRCRQYATQMLAEAAQHQTDLASPHILQLVQHCVSLVCLLQHSACGSRLPTDSVAVALRSLEPHCSANLDLFRSVKHSVEQLADLFTCTASPVHVESSSAGSVQRSPQ